jgi:hypothetical protein
MTKERKRRATVAVAVVAFLWKSCSGEPIYISTAGSTTALSERRVCAALLEAADRPSGSWSRQWWIVLRKGSGLYTEIKQAKRIEFEIDPGSGVRRACVGFEQSAEDPGSIVDAAREQCGASIRFLTLLGSKADQVALRVDDEGKCDRADAATMGPGVRYPFVAGKGWLTWR